MPIFEYHCEKCSQTFEKLSKKLEDQTTCPDCGEAVQKVVSAFSSNASCAAPAGSGFG